MNRILPRAAITLLLVLAAAIAVMPVQAATRMTTAGWKYKVDNEDNIGKLGKFYIDFLLKMDPGYGMTIGIHGSDDDFSWKAFNERLVTAGSPPFFALRVRMLGEE